MYIKELLLLVYIVGFGGLGSYKSLSKGTP